MSKSIFFLALLALVAVAYAFAPMTEEAREISELYEIIRMGKMCPCKCLVSKKGKKAVKKVCRTKRRKRDCERKNCINKKGRKGKICCNKEEIPIVSPEAMM